MTWNWATCTGPGRPPLDAGAPGLLAAVDFHIAAIHGVRFEPEPALAAARRCLDEARRVGVVRQQAWGWILIGQAHAVAGRRAQAAAAADEAERLAPGDQEILGLAAGTCRGLASLLAGDRDRAVAQFRAGVEQLRPLPRVPLPPWYLWPLIALIWTDTDGPHALTDADDPALRVAAGPDALWHLAAAVAAGHTGDLAAAQTHLEHAEQGFRGLPGFTGYRHIGLRLAAEAAITDGWGDPGGWLTDAETWSTSLGFDAFAASCRALQRRAGVPQTTTRPGRHQGPGRARRARGHHPGGRRADPGRRRDDQPTDRRPPLHLPPHREKPPGNTAPQDRQHRSHPTRHPRRRERPHPRGRRNRPLKPATRPMSPTPHRPDASCHHPHHGRSRS